MIWTIEKERIGVVVSVVNNEKLKHIINPNDILVSINNKRSPPTTEGASVLIQSSKRPLLCLLSRVGATRKVTGERSSAVQSEGSKESTTDLQVSTAPVRKDVRSADTTTATHERSVVRRHIDDDNHQVDP